MAPFNVFSNSTNSRPTFLLKLHGMIVRMTIVFNKRIKLTNVIFLHNPRKVVLIIFKINYTVYINFSLKYNTTFSLSETFGRGQLWGIKYQSGNYFSQRGHP